MKYDKTIHAPRIPAPHITNNLEFESIIIIVLSSIKKYYATGQALQKHS